MNPLSFRQVKSHKSLSHASRVSTGDTYTLYWSFRVHVILPLVPFLLFLQLLKRKIIWRNNHDSLPSRQWKIWSTNRNHCLCKWGSKAILSILKTNKKKEISSQSSKPSFPQWLYDSPPNNALVFTQVGTIYSKLEARLGWDETSIPVKASDLKSDPSQTPIQSVKFFCWRQWATNWTGEWEEVLDLSGVTVDAWRWYYFSRRCHLSAQRLTLKGRHKTVCF